jgi:protein SCO1/2
VHWSTQNTADGWHFLTADAPSIARLTEAAGFTYQWDDKTGQFAHVSGVLTVTPDGKVARYFYGVEYSPKDLRLALVESGQGRIGSKVEELLLYCFHYDPEVGRYGWAVMTLVRLGGALTVAFVLGFVLLMRRREGRAPVERHA